MVWPVVIPSELGEQWRPISEDELTTATARLPSVEAELRRLLRLHGVTGTPTFDTVEESDEWEALYIATVLDVLRGFLTNTDGALEETERIDDYSRTRRWDSSTSEMSVTGITEDAVIRLVPRTKPRRGAFSIRLGAT